MKRINIFELAKNFARMMPALATFAAVPYESNANEKTTEPSIFAMQFDRSAAFRVSSVTTATPRSSHIDHSVSNTQLMRRENVEISKQVNPTQDQIIDKIQQLNELGAVEAKCFRVKPYPINAAGMTKLRKIDYPLVDHYIDNGSPQGTPMSREKIMADIWLLREAALQAEDTPQRFRTFGLYLLQVQTTLINGHRYFGNEGFKWAQKLVNTQYDHELAEHISHIVPSKFYTHRLNLNMLLFAQSRAEFIPCSVRAIKLLEQKRQSS